MPGRTLNKIAIIEDNLGDFYILQGNLALMNVSTSSIVHFKNLHSFEKYGQRKDFNVCLLDLFLPDSQGVETLKRVIEVIPETPIIVMSGIGDESAAHEAMRMGAQDYLVKGDFDEKLLIKSISYAIERKRAIANLAYSNNLYRAMFIDSPLPMWIFDRETLKILMVNNAAQKQYGFTQEEFLNMTILELRPEEDREELNRFIEKNSDDTNPNTRIWRHIKKDKSIILVSVFSNAIHIEGKKGLRLVTAQDVTSQLKFEEENERLLAGLIARNDQLNDFAFAMSHNLKSPVASILGLCNLLAMTEEMNINPREVFEKLYSAANKLHEEMTGLNQIVVASMTPLKKIEIVRLGEMLEGAVQKYLEELKKVDAELIQYLDYEEVAGIREYYRNIFSTLFSNSIKFRNPGKRLKIKIKAKLIQGCGVRVTYTDNGLGLDLLKHGMDLFKIYKRFHPEIEGKGIELHLMKKQLEVMGGKIRVSSKPNLGTSFILELPASPTDNKEPKSHPVMVEA